MVEAKRGGAEVAEEYAEEEMDFMMSFLIISAILTLRSLRLCVSIDLHRLVYLGAFTDPIYEEKRH